MQPFRYSKMKKVKRYEAYDRVGDHIYSLTPEPNGSWVSFVDYHKLLGKFEATLAKLSALEKYCDKQDDQNLSLSRQVKNLLDQQEQNK
jgi:hypothetical protein